MQRFNDVDEIDRESDDLILANKTPDDQVARARQLRLRQGWHQPPVSPNNLNIKDAIRAVQDAMDTKARINGHERAKIGGYWKDNELQRSFARACIEVDQRTGSSKRNWRKERTGNGSAARRICQARANGTKSIEII